MGRRLKSDERKKINLVNITYEYLVNNFHKFADKTKIHVALEIQKKAMTQKVEHSGNLQVDFLASAIKKARDIDNRYTISKN